MSIPVYLNRIATHVPENEVHAKFLSYAPTIIGDERQRRLFGKLASKAHIDTRYSVVKPSVDPGRLDDVEFYVKGNYPTTEKRMRVYEKEALPLAIKAVKALLSPEETKVITHLIVTSCTGFYAPGVDLELQRELSMSANLERSIIGFMGCYAAFTGMRNAWHIVRSQPEAKVLMLNLELCSLHMQENTEMEALLGFMHFADGCAASVITAEPKGLRLDRFRTDLMPEGRDLITWNVGDQGFRMFLDPSVPLALGAGLTVVAADWLNPETRGDLKLWAIHPGGRSIIEAVGDKLRLNENDLRYSREVLRHYGNMSSAAIMFVLEKILVDPDACGKGAAMAFGPGLTMESMTFEKSL